MEATAKILENPIVSNSLKTRILDADRDAFFGVGYSHYPTSFEAVAGDIRYYLSITNTPKTRVYWNLRDTDHDMRDESGWRKKHALFYFTVEETKQLAADLGLGISDWLAGALEACRTDVTPSSQFLLGNVVEPAIFHAARAGDV